MSKFLDKYQQKSTRLSTWNYSNSGIYFITICTKNKIPFFGSIKKSKVELSSIGRYALDCWLEIPQHFKNIDIGKFVIMPNHLHGILINTNPNEHNDKATLAETYHATSLQYHEIQSLEMSSISPKKSTISTIIRSYKSAVTKSAKLIQSEFAWQARFYDHIVRNNKALESIEKYIDKNPYLWDIDNYFI